MGSLFWALRAHTFGISYTECIQPHFGLNFACLFEVFNVKFTYPLTNCGIMSISFHEADVLKVTLGLAFKVILIAFSVLVNRDKSYIIYISLYISVIYIFIAQGRLCFRFLASKSLLFVYLIAS